MDLFLIFAALLICLAWSCKKVLINAKDDRSSSKPVLPPAPPGLPLIGNLLQMSKKPHRALADLSKTYGHIMSLKLGNVMTIVMSSPEAAKETLQTHDQFLSSRTISDSLIASGHHESSMLWLPASTRWRFLRRISATQLFMPSRLDATKGLRLNKVQELLDFVGENCGRGQAVDIGRAAFITLLNMVSNTFFSVNFGHYDSDDSLEFYYIITGIVKAAGKPNIADFFPLLGSLDLQGIRKQMKNYQERIFVIFQRIIDERTKKRELLKKSSNYAGSDDLLDSLLDLNEENASEFSVEDMKHMLLDLFIGGIDTSSSNVEWAMTELIRNPIVMAKAQAEIREVICKKGVFQESDISELHYLRAIVKETFRLHPPIPFLIPRKAESDVKVSGYLVPKNAQVLVNVWAIGRDPSVWTNPSSFKPERFLEREIDVKGKDFPLLPFGAGRRICPGMPLAHRTVHLVLASLLYSFDWKLEDGVTAENLDMGEVFGLALHKSQPLRAVPIKT